MRRPVCYDVTRLLTRVLNATPNGIDRIDHALARHFLAGDATATFGATATGLGARLLSGPAAASAVDGIAAHWGETRTDVEADPAYRRVVAFLAGEETAPAPLQSRLGLRLPQVGLPRLRFPLLRIGGWIARHGLPVGRTPLAGLPPGSAYINVSQFPLWVASSFEWLEARRDVRGIFFIHDLLPLRFPEYYRAGEFARHGRRLANFARFGAGAMVTTRTVADELDAHLRALGRPNVPIFVAPMPISPVFATPRVFEPRLAGRPFFVLCSTLEPRKNHLMILAVWRALVERLGSDAPLLVLVGQRGWHYRPILDLIARSPALRDRVMEIRGLSTPGLKRLIDNAQALLMPSFGEGYGLPVHEALTAGAPVVASDIPVFREIRSEHLTLISPLDGEAWFHAICELTLRGREDAPATAPAGWDGYFRSLDAWIEAL